MKSYRAISFVVFVAIAPFQDRVSANEHQPWNLSFAAKDARAITESFQKRLAAGKEYSEIVPIELLSDVPNNHDPPDPKAIKATKQNLRNVLALLAGIFILIGR